MFPATCGFLGDAASRWTFTERDTAMDLRDSWQSAWERNLLHVSGMTDLYPNDFSTAYLRLDSDDRPTGIRTYRLGFARDKEPFCDESGVGPVHHYDASVPLEIRQIRVLTADGTEIGNCAVPPRGHGTAT
jgi:hypothetical protein